MKTKSLQSLHTIKLQKIILIIHVLLRLVEKGNHLQVNLEQCKFRLKKKKDIALFDDELKDSSDSSEAEWI